VPEDVESRLIDESRLLDCAECGECGDEGSW
jgi:hypothetical protein